MTKQKKVVKRKTSDKLQGGEKTVVKKRVALNSDDELFASGSENDNDPEKSSSEDDVAAKKGSKICMDCGDELMDSDERWKSTQSHKRCGAHANSAKRMLIKRDPELAKKWQKLKSSGKKKNTDR